MKELIIPRTKISLIASTKAIIFLPESWGKNGLLEPLIEPTNYFKISIKEYRKPRSTGPNSQCNHFNGHVRQICEATGNSFDLAKLAIKNRAVDEMGYPYETILNTVVPKSEGEANSYEASILIDLTHIIASELGIKLREEAW